MSKNNKNFLGTNRSNKNLDLFIKKLSSVPKKYIDPAGKILFGLDATASRQPMWDRATHIQAEMFEATLSLGSLEMQVAYYQGFGNFTAFPWSNDSKQIINYMHTVQCLGGLTQINKFLAHTLNELKKTKINAIVFIGDCMEENPDIILNNAGKIGLKGVPMFIFQEGSNPDASFVFGEMARITNGFHSIFDSSSSSKLKNLLKAIAIFATGGKEGLKKNIEIAPKEIKLLLSKVR
ncbi:MAG: hypothetical protein CFH01_01877 [Alphaproteobacteria bacterium MarineAlpha2_Bin1]|nr:MAG: hypothetical protein CFH01_01877 [Alphaproteobacteria bacterium MarineAlpha2_Bin1]